MLAYFEFKDTNNFDDKGSFANERLINSVNYAININSLEDNKEFKSEFKTIFRHPEDYKKQHIKS